MKKEKEVILLVKLLDSRFKNNKGGCKKDFEIEFNMPENHKEFRQWLNLLINEKILIPFEFIKNGRAGKPIYSYIVNKSNLLKKLRNEEIYTLFKRAIEQEHIVI